MRKTTSAIGRLPEALRTQVNWKLRDGWKYHTIVKWLFEQKVEQDIPDLNLKAGDPCSLIWTQNKKLKERPIARCIAALIAWFKCGYKEWLIYEANRDESIRLVDHIEKLTSEVGDKGQPGSTTGGTLLIRSLLLDSINKVRSADSNPEDLARLAHAWARVTEGGHRTQGHIDLGLQSLRDEIKTNPEALDAFNKLHGAVKNSKGRSS